MGCVGLTGQLIIPNGVTTIGDLTFLWCSGLSSLVISNSLTTIGNSAFDFCEALTSITIKATTPPTIGENAFEDTNNCPIYVPAGSVNAYKTATAKGWTSEYANRIQAIPA